MPQRLAYAKLSSGLYQKYLAFNTAVKETIAPTLVHLVTIRASQINGCGFCLDMHIKEARIHGERELRLHHIAIWRESQLFDARERAALAWTEALTQLPPHGVPDALYQATLEHFSDQELSDLSFLVVAINGWNRINVAFTTEPGSADAALGLDKAGLT